MFIAHRGLTSKNINENTISAFDNAFNNGYDGIELDIRQTKDKKIVIIHDSFISRVSNGNGLVKNYTYDELLQYNFGLNTTERIPLLEEVINRYNNKIIFIELKEYIPDIEKYLNKNNTYYIMSFNYEYIKDIPKSNRYKIGIINYIFNNINLNKIDFIMILDSIKNDKLLKYYKDNNIEVVIYGVIKNINKKIDENIKYII